MMGLFRRNYIYSRIKVLGRHKCATISQAHEEECNRLAKQVDEEVVFPLRVEIIDCTEE
jgi:hypothetical protein